MTASLTKVSHLNMAVIAGKDIGERCESGLISPPVPMLRESARLDEAWHQDGDQDVQLEGEGADDGRHNGDLTGERQEFVLGQVQSDGSIEGFGPKLEVAVECDGDVEADHDDHGGVEDPTPA